MEAIAGSYITAFLLGLFSSGHCVAMCSSVIGALTFSLPAKVRQRRSTVSLYVLNYNIGRLLSYGLAGAIIGFLSAPLLAFNGHAVLTYLSAIVMITAGCYLGGWLPGFARIERIGAPLWQQLQLISRGLLPVRTPVRAFYLGAIWGWLPCGLVYAALAVAATIGDPLRAGLTMLAFGSGTLPAVMSAGVFASLLSSMVQKKQWRMVAGLLIIMMALLNVFLPMEPVHQHNH